MVGFKQINILLFSFFLYGNTLKINASSALILSLDGGGVRGLIETFLLEEIEKQLNDSIVNIADVMVGTSTGGLITLALTTPGLNNKPLYRPSQLAHLYQKEMKNIFDPSLISRLKRTFGLWRTKYSVTYFNRWLHNQFRSLLLKNTLIPTGVTTYNVTRREAVLLNSTHSSHPLYHNIPIQAAARATTAAPLYFDPYEWQDNYLVDGGIYANNPSHWGLQYAQNLFPQKESYTIVSLGTGLYHHAPYQGGGLLQGGSKVVHHLLDLPQQLVGLHLSQQKPSIIYHRLQPHLSEQVDLDDTTRNEALKEAAESAIKSPVFETILKALQKKKEEKAMG